MAKYYNPSGKFDPKAFIYFILIAIIALPLLGLAYAYAIWYIPFIYINFIIAGAFGFIIAWLISKFVIKLGKVRNNFLAKGFAILAGIIALYFHWVVWVDLVLNISDTMGNSRIGIAVSNVQADHLITLATNPSSLLELIAEISKVGTWGIRSATVSGAFLVVVWIIEAIIIIGATYLFTHGSDEPFCELSNQWFKSKTLPVFNYIENRPKLVADLEQSNPDAFNDLSYTTNIEKNHSLFTIYSSTQNENYLSVTNRRAKFDKDGKLDFDDTVIINHIYINNELKEKLLHFKEQTIKEEDLNINPSQIEA